MARFGWVIAALLALAAIAMQRAQSEAVSKAASDAWAAGREADALLKRIDGLEDRIDDLERQQKETDTEIGGLKTDKGRRRRSLLA